MAVIIHLLTQQKKIADSQPFQSIIGSAVAAGVLLKALGGL